MSKITELVLASRNKKKLAEFMAILNPLGIEVKSVLDYPEIDEIEETGVTFKENAAIKAKSVACFTGSVVLADDSGLRVDYLNGEPGVYSSRFAGLNASDKNNNELLLQKMDGVPSDFRGAEFVCVLALICPDNEVVYFEGVTKGRILSEPRGHDGFGYDPLFLSDDLGVSFAEAEDIEKNRVSHRGRAVEKLLTWLERQ